VNRGAETLSVGAIYGGMKSPATEWKAVLAPLTERLPGLRDAIESPLNMHVMFHVPGELLPDKALTGVRKAGYTRWINLVRVDVVLPRELPDDLAGHIRQLMADAITVAEQFARDQGIADDLPGLRAIIAQI
jgi:hypothetical protein